MRQTHVLAVLLAVAACDGDSRPSRAIALEHIVTIGEDDSGERYASMPLVSERLADGRYFVTEPWGPAAQLVRIHDAEGRFVQHVGREGDGPGEYRWPEFAYRVGDSVHIFDTRARRVTAIGVGEESGPQRPWMERPYTFLVLPDGSFLLTTGEQTTEGPILHVGRDGRLLRAFGDGQAGEPSHLAQASDGKVWAIDPRRPYLQAWTSAGQPGERLEYERAWFPVQQAWRGPTPTLPPQTRVTGAWADSANGLWLVFMVADADWASGLGSRTMVDGQEHYAIMDRTAVFDGVIERIDLATGAPTHHRRFDDPLGRVNAPWVIETFHESSEGWWSVTLSRVVTPSP